MTDDYSKLKHDELSDALKSLGLDNLYPPDDFEVSSSGKGYDPTGIVSFIDIEVTITRLSSKKYKKYLDEAGKTSALHEAFIKDVKSCSFAYFY